MTRFFRIRKDRERMEFKLDMHTHTIASGHAYATVLEMIRAAADRGLELQTAVWSCWELRNMRRGFRERAAICIFKTCGSFREKCMEWKL